MVKVKTKDSRYSDEIAVGTIGEHLVCADLLMQGYTAFLADKGCYYDVVAEINGKLARIQVKTTRQSKMFAYRKYGPYYQYHIRRYGKGGRKRYEEDDLEMFALVALDKKIIGYLPSNHKKNRQTIFIEPEELQKLTFEKVIKL